VLTEDPFSFTAAGEPWRTQSWLADIAYGWLHGLFGLSSVAWIVAGAGLLLVTTTGIRTYRYVGRSLPAAVIAILVMWLVVGYFTPRPVLISLALYGVVLVAAADRRLHWSLPLIFWIWAAVHGGFVVGIGFLVLEALRTKDRRLAEVAGVSTLAASITAHGWGTWEVLGDFVGNRKALDLIVEWGTPDFVSLEHFPFAFVFVMLLIAAMRGRLVARDLWTIVPFLIFAFTANRAVPLAGMTLVPWFAAALPQGDGLRAISGSSRGPINVVLAVLILGLPLAIPQESGLDEKTFPVAAARMLAPGPAFHDDGAGGYLIYAYWPDREVYVDDRAELYGEHFVEFVEARAGKPVWRDVFARYAIKQALLKLEDPLAEVLQALGWSEHYRDKQFLVLVEPRAG
jgi:hypothetical protein